MELHPLMIVAVVALVTFIVTLPSGLLPVQVLAGILMMVAVLLSIAVGWVLAGVFHETEDL
jgi:hypothetical protein